MYVPPHFNAPEPSAAHDVIDANPFALLVSAGGADLAGTHLPLDLDRARGPQGTLIGHMARANDHWRALDGAATLAIFSGPHAYVSPRWYAGGPAVPTWNYVAVHVYGRARVVETPDRLREILAALTRRYEGDGPWRMGELPEKFLDAMVRGIVGIEIEVARIEAKFKLSQNRSAADRDGVAAALEATGDAGDAALAATMRRLAAKA
ncbi:MAG: FMN-binding negative transcriptional regulator [Alphaproteobacteria bacterium]|nr:FMN-binding negative transcriptional regulator [Alphaproteobacteria bacterium]